MLEKNFFPEKIRGRSLFVNPLVPLIGCSLPEIRRWTLARSTLQPASFRDMECILDNRDSEAVGFLEGMKSGKAFHFLGEWENNDPEVAPHIHNNGWREKLWFHTHGLSGGWRTCDYGVFCDLKEEEA